MSFQQGLSGLNSSAKQLDAIGNNVANASTVGFKQSQAQFADMYAASLSGANTLQTGIGSRVVDVAQQFSQGNLSTTGNTLDMAINGQGFFQLEDSEGALTYSRNGQFQLDNDGYVISNTGIRVRGYQADETGQVTAAQGPLHIDASDISPNVTSEINITANLDSRDTAPLNSAFSTSDADSYNNSTSITVYDSLGVEHISSLYFQRQPITTVGNGSITNGSPTMTVDSTAGLAAGNTVTLGGVTYNITRVVDNTTLTVSPSAPNTVAPADGLTATTNAGSDTWNVFMDVDGAVVPATTPATAMATLRFATNGTLIAATPIGNATTSIGNAIISDPSYVPLGADPLPMTFEFDQLTQFGSQFGVSSLGQDGYASGRLSGFTTSAAGEIQGRYTNGQTKILGQISLANFTNLQGLQPIGDNQWVETIDSGSPVVGTPGSGRLGAIQAAAVEDSNVDLTSELVNMITAQRMYQANAQTIKAQDQILQTIVNLR